MRRSARFDATGTYRYGLIRLWDAARPRALFIMLNPSTADAEREDPTIRRCIGFARTWGFGSMEAVNLFAYRTTDPARLPLHPAPIGPANDAAIARAAGRAGTIVLAWGHHGAGAARAADVLRLLERR
ncbi:MAG: DUF1643 domain-containing protein, partial [Myxococcales bacterium]|nr:DUF1643 domain-containing protein [Myxococcales bacterium]